MRDALGRGVPAVVGEVAGRRSPMDQTRSPRQQTAMFAAAWRTGMSALLPGAGSPCNVRTTVGLAPPPLGWRFSRCCCGLVVRLAIRLSPSSGAAGAWGAPESLLHRSPPDRPGGNALPASRADPIRGTAARGCATTRGLGQALGSGRRNVALAAAPDPLPNLNRRAPRPAFGQRRVVGGRW